MDPDSPSPTLDFSWEFTDSFGDAFVLAMLLVIAALLMFVVYRTLQRPRLPVMRSALAPPRVSRSGVLKYLLTTPVVVAFWLAVLLLLLSTAAQERTAGDVATIAAAIIASTRVLAHLNEELAHEIAKTVPVAIITFTLIGGGFAGVERFTEVLGQFPDDLIARFWASLVVFDVLVTALWFGWQRWTWHREHRERHRSDPQAGQLRSVVRSWRSVGHS